MQECSAATQNMPRPIQNVERNIFGLRRGWCLIGGLLGGSSQSDTALSLQTSSSPNPREAEILTAGRLQPTSSSFLSSWPSTSILGDVVQHSEHLAGYFHLKPRGVQLLDGSAKGPASPELRSHVLHTRVVGGHGREAIWSKLGLLGAAGWGTCQGGLQLPSLAALRMSPDHNELPTPSGACSPIHLP